MMTSPKPKLTELLDWIDSHLVYCFSLIRNKYFHTGTRVYGRRLQSLENLTDQWRDGGSWSSRESLTLFSKQTDRWLCRCSLYGGILRSGYRQVICKSRKLHLEVLPSFPILVPLLLKLNSHHGRMFSQPRKRLFLSPC